MVTGPTAGSTLRCFVGGVRRCGTATGASAAFAKAALTSQPQRAGFPLVLELESVKVGKPAWVKISQVRTLSTRHLGKKLGRVSPDELQRLVEGLNEIMKALDGLESLGLDREVQEQFLAGNAKRVFRLELA